MPSRPAVILRATDIDRAELPFVQRLNSRSRFRSAWLSRLGGLDRAGISRARVPPGGESFAYHAHTSDDEWIYVLSGKAVALLDGEKVELGPGDFVALPAPQRPHLVTNPFDEDLVYLMGGDRSASDVLEYPELGKRFVLLREAGRVAFHELGAATYPFGRADVPEQQAGAPWRVLGCKGAGSAIVEAALALAEVPCEREEVDYDTPSPARDRLLSLNPLGQVPTVVLPDGSVMTESAAIVLHLDEIEPGAGLLPRPGDPLRREVLRQLTFLVAAVYPTFTYGDAPSKWVGSAAGPELRASTDEHRKNLWRSIEGGVRGPWLAGARFTVLDVYVWVMTHWRPGRDWFAEACPKLTAIAAKVDGERRLARVRADNF